MTVLLLPDQTKENPYQANLADALDEEVALGGGSVFLPILRAVRSADDVSVLHFHWLSPYIAASTRRRTAVRVVMTVLELLIVRLLGIPIVWTVHNVVPHDSTVPRLERWFKHAFVRLGFASALFVHCEAVKDEVVEEYKLPGEFRRRMVTVPHGHYLGNYRDELSREEARRELDLGLDETVFLFFGQIRPYKGVDTLIDAFTSIDEEDYRLLIVGRPITDAIRRGITAGAAGDDRIRTTFEFVPDDRIQLYMNAADVVVLPYDRITTSGSVILAMSFGKAIVVPRLGCIPELSDDEGTITYPTGADDGLSDALREANRRDLGAMGAHNQRLVAQYDWGEIAKTTSRVYGRVKDR